MKLVEFYCESHIEIGCSTCLITRHKGCEVLQLEKYINGGKFQRSCHKSNDMLQHYKKLFEDLVAEAGHNLDSLEKEKDGLVDDVKSMRNSLEALLQDIEEKIIREIGTYTHFSSTYP